MGAYTLLQDLTVATNSTSVVLNDFGTITKDDFVKIHITFQQRTVTENQVLLFANNQTTLTNYHSQVLQAQTSSVTAVRLNNSSIGFARNTNRSMSLFGYLKLSENDRYNVFFNSTDDNDSLIHVDFRYVTSSGATFTSGITSLTLQSATTDAIGTGSRIQIYKLDAVKVADITVTSNTTQVDISNLSIDKDSEYLLVADSRIQGNTMFLYPNDLTTASNYYAQMIEGRGSSALAQRPNAGRIQSGVSAESRELAYIYIKLSNIGAFTYQSYNARNQGTSGVCAENTFGSSTAENFTSITKLNIVSDVANRILAGSRFILYKLYE